MSIHNSRAWLGEPRGRITQERDFGVRMSAFMRRYTAWRRRYAIRPILSGTSLYSGQTLCVSREYLPRDRALENTITRSPLSAWSTTSQMLT
jgi:hypothetical protein